MHCPHLEQRLLDGQRRGAGVVVADATAELFDTHTHTQHRCACARDPAQPANVHSVTQEHAQEEYTDL